MGDIFFIWKSEWEQKKETFDNYKESNLYHNLKSLDNEELIRLLIKNIKKDPNKISLEDLDSDKNQEIIPDTIFNKKLTVLESIVKYLKENLNFSYKNIANSINRDIRNIWQIYNTSKHKSGEKFVVKDFEFAIPLSIFSNRKLSMQEHLVFYLKENFRITYHKIATIIERDDRTIWTVYQKAKKKNEKNQ